MAGDWIKFELSTLDKPEVYQIADFAGIDEDATIGKLLRVWGWFDQQTESGNAPIVSKRLLDRLCGVNGFCDHMVKSGWMIEEINESDSSLSIIRLPNFDRHNGKTAKNRALTAKRVAEHKNKANAEGNVQVTQGALPREEKRREDINQKTHVASSATGVSDLFGNDHDQPNDDSVKIKNKKLPFTYKQIQDLYNKICRGTLYGCDAMTEKRKRNVCKLAQMEFLGEKPFIVHGLPFWESYFRECLMNPHWRGETPGSTFKADFEFVTRPDKALKVLESWSNE